MIIFKISFFMLQRYREVLELPILLTLIRKIVTKEQKCSN
jgi:hypothetical protein